MIYSKKPDRFSKPLRFHESLLLGYVVVENHIIQSSGSRLKTLRSIGRRRVVPKELLPYFLPGEMVGNAALLPTLPGCSQMFCDSRYQKRFRRGCKPRPAWEPF